MDNLQEKIQKNLRICQYLGGPQDLDTFYHYPSDMNRCFRPDPKQIPSQTHQTEYCLTARHHQCPVYQANWNGKFPVELRSVTAGSTFGTHSRKGLGRLTAAQRVFLIGLLVTFLAVVLIAFFGMRTPVVRFRTINMIRELLGQEPLERLPALSDATATPGILPEPSPDPTNTPRPTSTFLPSPEAGPTDTPLASLTPQPSPTAFPTPGPGFETPFGPDNAFLIHVVASGESFSAIAQIYGTTAEVLQAVNPIVEGASLWVGRQLVVPIGAEDASALPAFEVLLTTAPTDLTEITDRYNTDAALVRFYNQLGESDLIPAGRWLILPVIEGE